MSSTVTLRHWTTVQICDESFYFAPSRLGEGGRGVVPMRSKCGPGAREWQAACTARARASPAPALRTVTRLANPVTCGADRRRRRRSLHASAKALSCRPPDAGTANGTATRLATTSHIRTQPPSHGEGALCGDAW